jgi:hypothetical protein
MRKGNLRLISFLLILVFSQKLGLRLWLHNWVHGNTRIVQLSDIAQLTDNGKKCACIEDLMMPMAGAHFIEWSAPVSHYLVFIASIPSLHLASARISPSLRGPPPAA